MIDADGLNALSPLELKGSEDLPIVLTPHIGEFKRLCGIKEAIKDKVVTARDFARKHNVIIVLKGERIIVSEPGGNVVVNPTGNPSVSRAGSGDALTGIITGILAQAIETKQRSRDNGDETNMDTVFNGVLASVYIAGLAGDIAAEKYGQRFVSATDVLDCLSEAMVLIDDRERMSVGVNRRLIEI